MTNESISNIAEKIRVVHDELRIHHNSIIEQSFEIGELLTQKKHSLEYGQYKKWIEDSLPFTIGIARSYVKFYEHRATLKSSNVKWPYLRELKMFSRWWKERDQRL